MKRLIVLLMITLLAITFVSAENETTKNNYKSGDEAPLGTITPCFGEMKVYVSYESPDTKGQYDIKTCVQGENYWTCTCVDNKFNVVLDTQNNVIDVFNVEVHYYISEPYDLPDFNITDNNSAPSNLEIENLKFKRISKYNDVSFGKSKVDEDGKAIVLPEFKLTRDAIITIGIFIALAFLIALIIWRQFTKEDKPKEKKVKKIEKTEVKEDYPIDDEINNLIKNL